MDEWMDGRTDGLAGRTGLQEALEASAWAEYEVALSAEAEVVEALEQAQLPTAARSAALDRSGPDGRDGGKDDAPVGFVVTASAGGLAVLIAAGCWS